MNRALVAIAFGTIITAGGIADVSAGDEQYYPGSICRELYGTTDIRFDGWSNLRNYSTTSNRYVTCPLAQDDPYWTSYFEVKVAVLDGHASEAVECTAIARDFGYPTFLSSVGGSSYGTGSDVIHLTLYNTDFSAYHFVNCTLPEWTSSDGYSEVDSIWYNEF